MPQSLKDIVKGIPGARRLARRLGLSSQSSWLFRRDVLQWAGDANVVKQLPGPYRAFARYASFFFARAGARDLPAGRAAFAFASLTQRAFRAKNPMRTLHLNGVSVVVNLRDPRFLQVVNELLESADTVLLEGFVHAGDTFIDIGANHGAFALVASQLVGEAGLVVAVEPQPALAQAVRQSLEATAPGPFEVHAVALGEEEGTVELLVPRSYSGTAGVFASHSGEHPHQRLTVPLRRFDEVVAWQTFPGRVFIKLDIEGSEYAFLKGAAEMIRTHAPVILMEINGSSMQAAATTASDLGALLVRLGYATYAELDAPEVELDVERIRWSPEDSRNVLLYPSVPRARPAAASSVS